ncbi:hypothetical protein [Rhodothalassium salexigens]|uniref:hypothetical protein n=1 Tax=Rhodothalassium salexigens TaxID=1086 RepID=UPI00191227DF|nr:hypothetical protein [Rhodothalassium salexigens]
MTSTPRHSETPPRKRPDWVVRHLEQPSTVPATDPQAREGYWLLVVGAVLCFAVTALILVYRGWFLSGSDARAFVYLSLLGFSTIGGLFFIGAFRMRSLGDKVLNKTPRRRARPLPVSHLRFGAETASGAQVKRQSSARLQRRQARREALRHMPRANQRPAVRPAAKPGPGAGVGPADQAAETPAHRHGDDGVAPPATATPAPPPASPSAAPSSFAPTSDPDPKG